MSTYCLFISRTSIKKHIFSIILYGYFIIKHKIVNIKKIMFFKLQTDKNISIYFIAIEVKNNTK